MTLGVPEKQNSSTCDFVIQCQAPEGLRETAIVMLQALGSWQKVTHEQIQWRERRCKEAENSGVEEHMSTGTQEQRRDRKEEPAPPCCLIGQSETLCSALWPSRQQQPFDPVFGRFLDVKNRTRLSSHSKAVAHNAELPQALHASRYR